jgi:ribosomal protein L37AE/L43A
MSIKFHKQCEVCCSSNWCRLSNDQWICIACIEEDIEQTWLDWEEQRILEEEE